MTTPENKIPVLLLHESSTPAYSIFNPNDWDIKSKQIIDLCAINYGLLIFTSKMINDIFENAHVLCTSSFKNLLRQWGMAKWELSKSNYFVDVPQLHLSVLSFLSSVKTFLDVFVQLIGTEEIISSKVHGFHKKGESVGGQLLQMLNNNARTANKEKARSLHKVIVKHKALWIDDAVNNRDLLIHPEGFSKIMFVLALSEKEGNLNLDDILKPTFGNLTFDKYAQKTLLYAEIFSRDVIECLRNS